jgi:hypothetical protein
MLRICDFASELKGSAWASAINDRLQIGEWLFRNTLDLLQKSSIEVEFEVVQPRNQVEA